MSLKDSPYLVSSYEACMNEYFKALSYGIKIQSSLLKLNTIQEKDYRTVDELKSDLIDIKEDAVQTYEYVHQLAEQYGRLLNILKPIIEDDADITDII